MKEGDGHGLGGTSLSASASLKALKLSFYSLFFGLPLVCAFAVPYGSVKSCQPPNHTSIAYQGFQGMFPLRGFPAGNSGSRFARQFSTVHLGLFPQRHFGLRPKRIFLHFLRASEKDR